MKVPGEQLQLELSALWKEGSQRQEERHEAEIIGLVRPDRAYCAACLFLSAVIRR